MFVGLYWCFYLVWTKLMLKKITNWDVSKAAEREGEPEQDMSDFCLSDAI